MIRCKFSLSYSSIVSGGGGAAGRGGAIKVSNVPEFSLFADVSGESIHLFYAFKCL